MKSRILPVWIAIVLLSTCFCETGLANDWRVERLTQLDTATAGNAKTRKVQCDMQTDKTIQDVCNRTWDLIDARFMRLRPALEFMIALDKVSGHDKLKTDLTAVMSKDAYDNEVHEIVAQIDLTGKLFTVDQSRADIRAK